MSVRSWQLRVIKEHIELKRRIQSLLEFQRTDIFKQLRVAEQNRLIRQFNIMKQYLQVLQERIENF